MLLLEMFVSLHSVPDSCALNPLPVFLQINMKKFMF